MSLEKRQEKMEVDNEEERKKEEGEKDELEKA